MSVRPPFRRSRYLPAAFALSAVVLLAAALSFGPVSDGGRLPEAAAQPAKTVTVSPASAKAGEKVTVRWEGFSPGAPVSIFQCRLDSLPVTWRNSCAEPTWTAGRTLADGTGSAQFVVWQFTIQGLGANPALFCGESGCGVAVTECDTELTAGLFATAPLGVLPGGTNPVDGGDDEEGFAALQAGPRTAPAGPSQDPPVGAASTPTRTIDVQAGQAMDPVLPELAEALEGQDIGLDSTVLNSPSALDAYVAGRTDLAFSGRPLSADQRQKLAAAGRPSVMIPIGLSPQALIHKMDVRGVPIQRFRLSVESAAKLYRGLISGVESPDLRRDNGGCGITASGKTTDRSVLGFFRTDRSSANYTFSTWLDTAGNDDAGAPRWPPVVDGGALAESPSEFFPNASTGQSKSNNRELAELVKLGTLPGAPPPVYTNDAGRLRIGYVDQSAVVELVKKAPAPEKPGLLPIRFVEIRNKAGKWVLPTPAAVRATIAASPVGPDNVVAVNAAAIAPEAYPLVSVVYAVVPAAAAPGVDPATAATGRDVIRFMLSAKGQSIMETAGIVPLSGELKTRADATAAALGGPAEGPTTTAPPFVPSEVLDEFGVPAEFGGSGDFGGSDLFPEADSGDTGGSDGSIGADERADGPTEEATGNSTISSSESLLERAAGAPALMAVLFVGLAAAVGGQVLRRVDKRKRAAAAQ